MKMNYALKYPLLLVSLLLISILTTMTITPLWNTLSNSKLEITNGDLNIIINNIPLKSNHFISNNECANLITNELILYSKNHTINNIKVIIYPIETKINSINENILIYFILLQSLIILLLIINFINKLKGNYIIYSLLIIGILAYISTYFFIIFPNLVDIDILFSRGFPNGGALYKTYLNNTEKFIKNCTDTVDCFNEIANNYQNYSFSTILYENWDGKGSVYPFLLISPIMSILLFFVSFGIYCYYGCYLRKDDVRLIINDVF
jgi:hypothetical protein